MYMKVNNVISFESQFTRRIIKSTPNVSLVEDSTAFMYDSNCRRTGCGLIYKYKQNVYVLSCSHIFPRGNKSAYFFGDIQFEMHPFISLKEMDVQIFKCNESNYRHAQFDMDEYLSNCSNIRGEYKLITPDISYNVSDVEIIHESNVSPLYPEVPTVAGKVPRIHPDKLCGISGSVITHNNFPIGLVSNYDSSRDIIKCIHIPFVLSIVKLLIDRHPSDRQTVEIHTDDRQTAEIHTDDRQTAEIHTDDRQTADIHTIELKGVDINTDICDIEYSSDDTSDEIINTTVHWISDNSREYVEDIQTHVFEKDSLILNVNDNIIDSNGLINCSDILNIDLKISLSAYSMISTTLKNTVSYSIMKQSIGSSDLVTVSVKGLTYNNIFKIHPLDSMKRIIWNNYVFCEMSTELIYNYESKGLQVSSIEKSNVNEYYKGMRRIILLTYLGDNKRINKKSRKTCEFKFPLVKKGAGVYFMTLVKVGVSNVRDIEHLYELLSAYKSCEASFTLTTLADNKKQKIYI
jgi:hypothetical protein